MTKINLIDLASKFEIKLNKLAAGPSTKPGIFNMPLPLSPPGRKAKEEPVKIDLPLDQPKVHDPKYIKDHIMHINNSIYTWGDQILRQLETLKDLTKSTGSAGIHLAHKVNQIVNEGYANTTASEDELGIALREYKSKLEWLEKVADHIKFYVDKKSSLKDDIKTIEEKI